MIEIKDLTLKLEDKDILKNINLSIDEGKIYGLIGPNGVGKTSLIKCLTGIYKITTGEILYDGSNVYDNAEVKKNIAYVADENNFFTSFLVRDVIKYYKLAYDNFNEEKFHKINKVFKIPLNKRLHQLSKGMKMRTFLMLGFAQEAKYIILDEPTSGLDPILKNKLLKLIIEEVSTRGTTIIISSHHLNELEKVCDEVVILDGGEVSYKNTLEEMKKKIKKIQVAFDGPVYEEDLNIKGIFKMSKVGRVFTILVDNYGEEFIEAINRFTPLFIEEIDLNLEDIFIYKLDEGDINEKIL